MIIKLLFFNLEKRFFITKISSTKTKNFSQLKDFWKNFFYTKNFKHKKKSKFFPVKKFWRTVAIPKISNTTKNFALHQQIPKKSNYQLIFKGNKKFNGRVLFAQKPPTFYVLLILVRLICHAIVILNDSQSGPRFFDKALFWQTFFCCFCVHLLIWIIFGRCLWVSESVTFGVFRAFSMKFGFWFGDF